MTIVGDIQLGGRKNGKWTDDFITKVGRRETKDQMMGYGWLLSFKISVFIVNINIRK